MADIKKFFGDTRSFLGRDYIPEMPEFEKIKVKDAEVSIMDATERDMVIDKLPAEHKPIFLFWKATGVRPCELTALKKHHLIWNAKIPYWQVQAELIGGIYRTITKTKNQWQIPLDVNEVAIIKSVPKSFTDYVFYWIDTRHKKKAKPYREQMLRNIWRDACAAAGVEYKHPYQSFRHSTITGWLDSGMSEDDASSLVGHKCRSTIKKYDKSKRIERLMKAKENL
jgi:integrase